jgi:hypothetical protein
MAAKYKNPPIWAKFGFQVDDDVANCQKLPHTTVDIPTKWIIIWLPNHGYQFPTSKSTWKQNFAEIGGFCILVAILDSNWPP